MLRAVRSPALIETALNRIIDLTGHGSVEMLTVSCGPTDELKRVVCRPVRVQLGRELYSQQAEFIDWQQAEVELDGFGAPYEIVLRHELTQVCQAIQLEVQPSFTLHCLDGLST